MGINLYTGKVYKIELSEVLMYGATSKEAMYDLFQEFEISHGADDEFDDEYEIKRSELQRFQNEIVNHTEYFQERTDYFAKKLGEMNLTEEEFINALDGLIGKSDQTNEFILLTWI